MDRIPTSCSANSKKEGRPGGCPNPQGHCHQDPAGNSVFDPAYADLTQAPHISELLWEIFVTCFHMFPKSI